MLRPFRALNRTFRYSSLSCVVLFSRLTFVKGYICRHCIEESSSKMLHKRNRWDDAIVANITIYISILIQDTDSTYGYP